MRFINPEINDTMRKMFLLLTIVLILGSCNERKEEPIINFDYDIQVNGTFQVELISNHTTGYSWKWANADIISIVDSVDYSYIPDTAVLVGSGGKEIWTFKGVHIGIDSLKFDYCKSWELNSTVENKNFIVKVK